MTTIPPCKFGDGDIVVINPLGQMRLTTLNLKPNTRYKVTKTEWQSEYSPKAERGYIVTVEKFGGMVDAFWEAFLDFAEMPAKPLDAAEYEEILSAQEVYEEAYSAVTQDKPRP